MVAGLRRVVAWANTMASGNRRTSRSLPGKRSAQWPTNQHRRAWLAALIVGLLSAASALAGDRIDGEAARREGKVIWYTSGPAMQAQKLAALFEAQHGVKVELFRSGSTAILRRFLQEAQAGRVAADVISMTDPATAASLSRKGVFAAFKPANFDKIRDEAKDPNGYYVACRLNMITLLVRTDKLAPADIPRTWRDLADPKYKGRIVLTDPSSDPIQLAVVGTLSRRLGWSFFEQLRRNEAMVVHSHQQVADMMKRGERLIAAGVLDSRAVDMQKDGYAIQTIYPEDGVLVIPEPSAVVQGAPHPHAARLFAAFLIGDAAQKEIVADGTFSARVDLPAPEGAPPLTEIRRLPVDHDDIERQAGPIKKNFNETFQ